MKLACICYEQYVILIKTTKEISTYGFMLMVLAHRWFLNEGSSEILPYGIAKKDAKYHLHILHCKLSTNEFYLNENEVT